MKRKVIVALLATMVVTGIGATAYATNDKMPVTSQVDSDVTSLNKEISTAKTEKDRVDGVKASAKAVDDSINAIGNVTLESETAITTARTSYDGLTDEGKGYVTALNTLTTAETSLQALKDSEAQKQAVAEAEAKAKAEKATSAKSTTKAPSSSKTTTSSTGNTGSSSNTSSGVTSGKSQYSPEELQKQREELAAQEAEWGIEHGPFNSLSAEAQEMIKSRGWNGTEYPIYFVNKKQGIVGGSDH